MAIGISSIQPAATTPAVSSQVSVEEASQRRQLLQAAQSVNDSGVLGQNQLARWTTIRKEMRNHGYQSYFDDEVLAASPLKLIQLLYGATLDSIAAARRHIRNRDIRARARAINRAIRIISELSQSLNHEADEVLSRNLAGLYGYVARLLVEANAQQIDAPLAEAEALLSTLAEAWKTCTPISESGFLHVDLRQSEASHVATPLGGHQ